MSTQTIFTGMMVAWTIGWLMGRWVGIGSSSRPRDRDPDWRRSFTHEGHVQRGNRFGAGYQPKPQIDPKGQRRTPNPPPSEP